MQDNKKNIRQRNDKGIPHGYWKVYWEETNEIWYSRFYLNWNIYGYRTMFDEKSYYAR